MKKQYLLYLLLENWAIRQNIFIEIGAWFMAFEKGQETFRASWFYLW